MRRVTAQHARARCAPTSVSARLRHDDVLVKLCRHMRKITKEG